MKGYLTLKIMGDTKMWDIIIHEDIKYINDWKNDQLDIEILDNYKPSKSMNMHYSITVSGLFKDWSFDVFCDDKFVERIREDGIEIDEVIETFEIWNQN
jgi:hypothetical protein